MADARLLLQGRLPPAPLCPLATMTPAGVVTAAIAFTLAATPAPALSSPLALAFVSSPSPLPPPSPPWSLTHAAWNALMHALWGNTPLPQPEAPTAPARNSAGGAACWVLNVDWDALEARARAKAGVAVRLLAAVAAELAAEVAAEAAGEATPPAGPATTSSTASSFSV